jgi:arginase
MMTRIYFPSSLGQKKAGVDTTAKYLKQIFGKTDTIIATKSNDTLSSNLKKLYRSNMKATLPTINIGGDHSMAIATVAASLQKHGSDLKVIWFDAHADINTRATSPSGNFHGMPLAFLTGLDHDFALFPFLYAVPELKFENILYLGIRDLDPGEKKVLKDKQIKYVKSADINNDPKRAFEIVKAFVGNDPVHLSFDVDGIDPGEMPCTGTTAKRGVHVEAIKPVLDKIMKKTNLVNMDITEFNLEIGDDRDREISTKNFVKLFQKYL